MRYWPLIFPAFIAVTGLIVLIGGNTRSGLILIIAVPILFLAEMGRAHVYRKGRESRDSDSP